MINGRPIVYNAILLTAVNLILRFTSTSFQVYLSGKIGPEGIGLLQLVMSVGSLAITAGMGGIRTATMYLCAEVIGQKRQNSMIWVLSGCILYSIILSTAVGLLLYYIAPMIADRWIGKSDIVGAIRLFSYFLPANCLCGVMIGYFTAVNRIGTLTAVEIIEQLISMSTTITLLTFWAGSNPVKSCHAAVLGSGMGGCFTLFVLLLIKAREQNKKVQRISIRKKLWKTAIPLGFADDIKAGISTAENIIVPKRLALYSGESAPLSTFGMICGMVFPVLMFPSAILFGLAELLIPELARCNAAESTKRIRYLAKRSLMLTLLYGCLCGGIQYLSADLLCNKLYHTPEAAIHLRRFAILVPMIYCDIIVDAMTKGLGQQKICVRYNILTSTMDVILLFILLPRYGINGYFVSFTITHLINFLMSINLLQKLIGKVTRFYTVILSFLATISGVWGSMLLPKNVQFIGFLIIFTVMLIVLNVLNQEEYRWIIGLMGIKKKK